MVNTTLEDLMARNPQCPIEQQAAWDTCCELMRSDSLITRSRLWQDSQGEIIAVYIASHIVPPKSKDSGDGNPDSEDLDDEDQEEDMSDTDPENEEEVQSGKIVFDNIPVSLQNVSLITR